MSRSIMPVLVVALAVATGVLGYAYYSDHYRTHGVELSVDPNGITLLKK